MKDLKKYLFVQILMLIFVSSLHFSVYGQTAETSSAKTKGFREFKLESLLMKREMPYRVILPVGYEVNAAQKFPVIYLLHGLTGHFDNWTDKTKIVEYAKNYDYIIVMPEGNDGWYSDSVTVPDDKFESYIVKELIPEIEKKFRALSNRESRAIAGLSMGGYGALKFGLKYPEKFVLAGSFSGALMAAGLTVKEAEATKWQALIDSIKNTFGDDDSETRKQNDLFKIVKEKNADQIKNLPFFYLDCGTEDGLISTNRQFMMMLAENKISHEYRELPGAHNWIFWDAQVLEFLQVSEKYLKASKAKGN